MDIARQNTIYDNAFSKPPQIGTEENSHLSVLVLFEVNIAVIGQPEGQPGIYSGQYDFTMCEWRANTRPGSVPDEFVTRWWHLPEYSDILAKYNSSGGTLRSIPLEVEHGKSK